MYSIILTLHSFMRWLVLASLLYSACNAWWRWRSNRSFRKHDNILRQVTISLTHLQFALGVTLYFSSPITDYFMHNFSEAIHNRGARFFGMEHITMMAIAVSFITHGSVSSKKRDRDQDKFKVMAIWYSMALLIILLSIPWPFSPFTARPYWRL